MEIVIYIKRCNNVMNLCAYARVSRVRVYYIRMSRSYFDNVSTYKFIFVLSMSQDERNTDQKSIFWPNGSHSESGSILDSSGSSNSSVISEDINTQHHPQMQYASYTAFILNQQVFNGHKKLNRSQSEPRGRYNRHIGGTAHSK